MLKTNPKTVYELPADVFEKIIDSQQRILAALETKGINVVAPEQNPVTAGEFMRATSMGRWKFNFLKDSGRLRTIRLGRKLYVPHDQIKKYFAGELTLDD